MGSEKKVPIGTDGKPMTSWQVWLRRLCIVLIVWAALEVVLGVLLVAFSGFVPADLLKGIKGFGENLDAQFFAKFLGVSAMVGAAINVVVALLGIRGAKNPQKIALFFWIALIDAVVTAWALASSISQGALDPSSLISGLFIISLAVCAWQVRKQTGYFDIHP
ncbi:hypothetical protein [Raoultibacter phocaeensis]|uniref:hypothetical protein n=1 Tax=Raoultibacter phocaeensis TaxID=2479841 RepID=UPI001118BD73|nr:hypothetical protein [Raoultibacter phocaeensis]